MNWVEELWVDWPASQSTMIDEANLDTILLYFVDNSCSVMTISYIANLLTFAYIDIGRNMYQFRQENLVAILNSFND